MVTTNIYESRQGEYRAGTISMTALGVVFVFLRFLARWKKGLRIGADDYVILLSLVSTTLEYLSWKSLPDWMASFTDSSCSYSRHVRLIWRVR